jgi:protein-L-isoaspartate(D-aspartate) O-methyltransferase
MRAEIDEMIAAVEAMARATEVHTGRRRFSPATMAALEAVPRAEFVEPEWRARAHENRALPAREGQTISQPYIVALMTDLLQPLAGEKVLDVGAGTGYQAAVLAFCGARVTGVEIRPALAQAARATLDRLRIANVDVRAGDGREGWPEGAPYDGILVAAASADIPGALISQLAPGGRLVLPFVMTGGDQTLLAIDKRNDGAIAKTAILPVAFVPLIAATP